MNNQKTIRCAFCQGTGKNPHYAGSCPVCKGKRENQIRGKYMTCSDCHGKGQKGGTTLTCYNCGGLGIVPDTREIVQKARQEIQKAQEEMEKERQEFREKTQSPPSKQIKKKGTQKKETKDYQDKYEDFQGRLFCQCCGNNVQKNSVVKVCLKCFRKIKSIKE